MRLYHVCRGDLLGIAYRRWLALLYYIEARHIIFMGKFYYPRTEKNNIRRKQWSKLEFVLSFTLFLHWKIFRFFTSRPAIFLGLSPRRSILYTLPCFFPLSIELNAVLGSIGVYLWFCENLESDPLMNCAGLRWPYHTYMSLTTTFKLIPQKTHIFFIKPAESLMNMIITGQSLLLRNTLSTFKTEMNP